MINSEILLDIGKKKGLTNKEHIEKDYLQDVLLFNIFKKTNKLVFRGGTALYKLYGLQRFSEDIDFSVIENTELKSLEDMLRRMLDGIGYFHLKSVKKTKDSLLFKIAVDGILTRYNTLRVDINFRNKIIKGYDVKNYVPEYFDINPFSLRVLKLDEIIAEKIHSIFMREKTRDLFDLFFLLRIARFDKKLVEEKLKLFGIRYNAVRARLRINRLRHAWEKELRPFILGELPDFNVVRDFVVDRLGINKLY